MSGLMAPTASSWEKRRRYMSRTKAPRLVMEVGETGKGKLTAAFVHMVNKYFFFEEVEKRKGLGAWQRRWWWTSWRYLGSRIG